MHSLSVKQSSVISWKSESTVSLSRL